ncbi:MAG: hypothetical protein AAGK14_13600 [Verrucomicrobiota bacterium]
MKWWQRLIGAAGKEPPSQSGTEAPLSENRAAISFEPVPKQVPTLAQQREWREKVLVYVGEVNDFGRRYAADPESMAEALEPACPALEHLAVAAVNAIRQANETGDIERLREEWPPAQEPLIPVLEKNGISIPTVCILSDQSVVVRVGTAYQPGRTFHLTENEARELPDPGYFGRSPCRRYFAYAREAGVEICEGWLGRSLAICSWPNGLEGIPSEYHAKSLEKVPTATRLVPFPDGRKVLLVAPEGVFLLHPDRAVRLLPTEEDIRLLFDYELKEGSLPQDLSVSLSMEHGAVSPDGKLIAAGNQDSKHHIFDAEGNLLAEVGPLMDYPHHALFAEDGSLIAFNSCHFYDGVTLAVPVHLLPGLSTKSYEEDERTPVLEDGSRVYAGAARGDEFVIGDASGVLRAFSTAGQKRWVQRIGSSTGAIDISADGRMLVASTYAGFVSFFRLDAGRQAPHQIGYGNHEEVCRWIFWKHEENPLRW